MRSLSKSLIYSGDVVFTLITLSTPVHVPNGTVPSGALCALFGSEVQYDAMYAIVVALLKYGMSWFTSSADGPHENTGRNQYMFPTFAQPYPCTVHRVQYTVFVCHNRPFVRQVTVLSFPEPDIEFVFFLSSVPGPPASCT